MITPEELAERKKCLEVNIIKSLAYLCSLPGSEAAAADGLIKSLEEVLETPSDPTLHVQVLVYSTLLLTHTKAEENRQRN